MKWAVSMILVLCLALPAWGAEAGPETNRLPVKVGPFFIQENDKKINLEGAGPHVIRPGKRINITVTIENPGREKSEPVKLKYVESGKKAGEPRFYRVQAIDPGKTWQRTFMARYEESGKKIRHGHARHPGGQALDGLEGNAPSRYLEHGFMST